MKKIFITVLLLVCLTGCCKTQEVADENLLVEDTETIEEVASGDVEAVSEDDDSATADTTEKKKDATVNTSAGASTGLSTSSTAGNNSTVSTLNAGSDNVVVAPEVPVTPASVPTPTPAPSASANAGGGDASKPTMKDLEQLAPGSQIGDSGFTWGAGVGGLGTGTPTTDGYGDGTTITIEPVN